MRNIAEMPKVEPSAVIMAKILSVVILGLSTLTAGSLPVFVFKRLGIVQQSRSGVANTMLRLILNFGGGVLLCTTFTHMLPEVREGVENLVINGMLDSNWSMTGRLAELVMCIGFLIMYCIENLAHGHGHGHEHGHGHNDQQHQPQKWNSNGSQQNPNFKIEETISATCRVTNYNSCALSVTNDKPVQPKYASNSEAIHHSFLIILALCVHEIFEGLAIGLEKNPTEVSML